MRKDYIEKQKGEGRKVLAVLPIHYPKEILTAMNILGVELWGPPGPPKGPSAGRVQTYICAVARNAVSFVADKHAEMMDGILFPHTCDSIQGMGTLLSDLGGWDKKSFFFIHPRGQRRRSLEVFLEAELRKLAADLATLTGTPMKDDALLDAIRLHREIDALRGEFLDKRWRLAMNDVELYELLRRGEWLWPEDHLRELTEAKKQIKTKTTQKGLPVMITGIVPEPMSIFKILGEAGAFVAADDYAGIGRRIVKNDVQISGDPFKALAELYYAAPSCPTRHAQQSLRMDYLADLAKNAGVLGLIIHEVKFCEPELFDVPAIKETFAKMEIPLLYLETELEKELPGQAVTRLEAFIEIIERQAKTKAAGKDA
jgi:benzoyl-CoA reductase/2-hydroxyglutaryl-CoA dehydratase subunit BcrC/BadD/HgdB